MNMRRCLSICLLGACCAATPAARADGFLFDFGADATTTGGGPAGPPTHWNNVSSVGTSDAGVLDGLLDSNGNATAIGFQMVSRFNGANESGTTTASLYPASATRDSLFGNTEVFSGLENITPIFKLVALDPAARYDLTFYASRTGVSDNRETLYTVTGTAETAVALDASNNQTNVARVTAAAPDANGELTVALAPGPNNNNANHFVYLGVLEIKASTGERLLVDFGAGGTPTDVVEPAASAAWNNVTATVGTRNDGLLEALVTTNGTATTLSLRLVSRFNGANANGTTASTNFPVTATQDSLFGNTETFSGLANILPVFELAGLDTNSIYGFSFFGSRTGVSDNRETRYTVIGATTGEALLDCANNTNRTASVTGMRPDANGVIRVALTPGPANNNANHFTYLGVMKVDSAPRRTPRILVDFGGGNTTDLGSDDPDNAWNNVIPAIGGTDTNGLPSLVRTDGSATSIGLRMVSRFNGANENGTQAGPAGGAPYPVEATRDSLFGNTEAFSGLENVTPVFKLVGLNPATAYDLTFFASRLGVGDNRETRYTVTGAAEATADLNAANNETQTALVSGARPNAAGELTLALSPGPNNDNANHFVYLGVLQLDWSAPASAPPARLAGARFLDGKFRFALQGTPGTSYTVQRTTDFKAWQDVQTVSLAGASQDVELVPSGGNAAFYRVVSP